ncbi:uncharacterized protein LOC119367557 isoform X2 [Triticum dicoccoides]|nr:uncharacterized protein LOC119367557 isoform X2 [Triticum dicoccoides]
MGRPTDHRGAPPTNRRCQTGPDLPSTSCFFPSTRRPALSPFLPSSSPAMAARIQSMAAQFGRRPPDPGEGTTTTKRVEGSGGAAGDLTGSLPHLHGLPARPAVSHYVTAPTRSMVLVAPCFVVLLRQS